MKKNQVVHIDISEQFKKECEYEIKTAKSEAIKEFAERLKAKTISFVEYDEYGWGERVTTVKTSSIDNLVKEMVGEQG